MSAVQLGLGLIGIGRRWGFVPGEAPAEADVRSLLDIAFELGIRYFDTAPSYGLSEERLGAFLRTLNPGERSELTVATKFGEHWNAAAGEPFIDHSFEALCRSLDRSLALLGSIDVLQLHKTTPEVLASGDLARAWEYARSLGIARLGASVSDPESARLALADPGYSIIQIPYNRAHPRFGEVIDRAGAAGVLVAVNRPLAMGAMLYDAATLSKVDAFRFILRHRFRGVVLTGTRSPDHLRENWQAFREALPLLS
jgi:aryl-alcohol dehydrogenase-like predicted oxidoreductase